MKHRCANKCFLLPLQNKKTASRSNYMFLNVMRTDAYCSGKSKRGLQPKGCKGTATSQAKAASWDSLEIIGNPWKSLEMPIGNLWESLEIFGNRWKSLEIFGSHWKPMISNYFKLFSRVNGEEGPLQISCLCDEALGLGFGGSFAPLRLQPPFALP